MKKSVLFLCTANSCRSQIAEAVTNHFHADRWQAFSAGTQIADQVHPAATAVLKEIDIMHHGQPKPVTVFQGQDFDLVVTVCDQAERSCPAWLGSGKKVHHGFRDPAAASGTEEEIMDIFRQTRDQIIDQISNLLTVHWDQKEDHAKRNT